MQWQGQRKYQCNLAQRHKFKPDRKLTQNMTNTFCKVYKIVQNFGRAFGGIHK